MRAIGVAVAVDRRSKGRERSWIRDRFASVDRRSDG
jgi:hypothetical protein